MQKWCFGGGGTVEKMVQVGKHSDQKSKADFVL